VDFGVTRVTPTSAPVAVTRVTLDFSVAFATVTQLQSNAGRAFRWMQQVQPGEKQPKRDHELVDLGSVITSSKSGARDHER